MNQMFVLFLMVIGAASFLVGCSGSGVPERKKLVIPDEVVSDIVIDRQDSPFVMAKDVTVPAGIKMVIKAGVEVVVAPDTQITIAGALVAEGTERNPVEFSVDPTLNVGTVVGTVQTDPKPGDWKGIVFESTADPATFAVAFDAPKATDILDGETFSITAGGTVFTFEFDHTDTQVGSEVGLNDPTAIAITLESGDPATTVAQTVVGTLTTALSGLAEVAAGDIAVEDPADRTTEKNKVIIRRTASTPIGWDDRNVSNFSFSEVRTGGSLLSFVKFEFGGGIWIKGAAPMITDSVFVNNAGVQDLTASETALLGEGNTFVVLMDNRGSSTEKEFIFANNLVEDNLSGGLAIIANATANGDVGDFRVQDCRFANNAGSGLAVWNSTTDVLNPAKIYVTGTLFTENCATRGSGIMVGDDGGTLVNGVSNLFIGTDGIVTVGGKDYHNDFSRNSASTAGPAIYFANNVADITGNVFAANVTCSGGAAIQYAGEFGGVVSGNSFLDHQLRAELAEEDLDKDCECDTVANPLADAIIAIGGDTSALPDFIALNNFVGNSDSLDLFTGIADALTAAAPIERTPPSTPARPVLLTSQPPSETGEQFMTIGWKDAFDDIMIDQYEVEKATNGGAFQSAVGSGGSFHTWTARPGVNYQFRVRAKDPSVPGKVSFFSLSSAVINTNSGVGPDENPVKDPVDEAGDPIDQPDAPPDDPATDNAPPGNDEPPPAPVDPQQDPAVSIVQPATATSVADGTTVNFMGNALDPQDGQLTGGSLVWNSSLDGQLGTGGTLTVTSLSVGIHQITLTATDGDQNTAKTEIEIAVNPVDAPTDEPPATDTPADAPPDCENPATGGDACGGGSGPNDQNEPLPGDSNEGPPTGQ